jgi:CRP-like cAMP-binding protein
VIDGEDDEEVTNSLLERFPPALRAQIVSGAECAQLRHHQVLYEPDTTLDSVYFPLRCLISLVTKLQDGKTVETMMIDSEGMLGATAVLAGVAPAAEAVVQVPGPALRVSVAQLREMIVASQEAKDLLLRYSCFILRYMALQASCNALHRLEQRCCRWLLASSDKLRTDTLPVTHEYFALILGVRRPALTSILGQLQKAGLLRQKHGCIELVDRAGLRSRACECYDLARTHYATLLASPVVTMS